VDTFSKTLAKLASRPVFSLAKTENNWPNIKKGSVRGEKMARLARGFVILLTNLEFYSHLASWQVVIPNPDPSHTYTIQPTIKL
jgi:hypothetical protein